MAKTAKERSQEWRDRERKKGLIQILVWVPDTKNDIRSVRDWANMLVTRHTT